MNNHEHLMSAVLDYLQFLSSGASYMPFEQNKTTETKFRALQGQIDYSVKIGDEVYLRRRFVSEGPQRPEATAAVGTATHNVLYTHTNRKKHKKHAV